MTRPIIAVLGGSGQLGTDLVEVLRQDVRFDVVAFSRGQLDVTDAQAVGREIVAGRFEAVIDTAAITNVDWCEENGAEAMEVNATGAYLVARACREAGSRNVFVSTDFVFDGEKEGPYDEADEPRPINIYGASKLVGERVAQIAAPDSLIVRISSVFGKAGSRGKGGNFVETILERARANQPLRVVDDTVMSPSYTMHVARALADLLATGATGLVHLSNRGSCSWFEFASRALELAGIDADITAVGSSEFARAARRPSNSTLESARLKGLIGREMPHWLDALEEYLQEKGYLVNETVGEAFASEDPS
ncbi:MAG TPA: dTDP-4-dehydrorhamnose reductase [Trueperaceae bacterium]